MAQKAGNAGERAISNGAHQYQKSPKRQMLSIETDADAPMRNSEIVSELGKNSA